LHTGPVQTSQGTGATGNVQDDRSVTIHVGDVASGASVTISYRVRIRVPLPPNVTQIANQAVYWGGNVPPTETNDPDTPVVDDVTGTHIGTSESIEVYKNDAIYEDGVDGALGPGDVLLYQIILENLGLVPATGVTFHDVPDTNTALIAGSVRTSLG